MRTRELSMTNVVFDLLALVISFDLSFEGEVAILHRFEMILVHFQIL